MRWDRFFADLEDQLDAEWEAERAALETESERLRLSRLRLRDRLGMLADGGATPVRAELADGSAIDGAVAAAGADWFAVLSGGPAAATVVVPLAALVALTLPHADQLRSARAEPRAAVSDRMTLGFVLRDLARRRVPVTIGLPGGRALSGTVDRAAADHIDLAVHDAGVPRHPDAVRAHRVVVLAAVVWVRLAGDVPGA